MLVRVRSSLTNRLIAMHSMYSTIWSTHSKYRFMPDHRTWRIRFGKRHKKRTPIRDGTSLNDAALLSPADTPSLSMVPALALGISDVQKRVEAQAKTSEAHKAKLEVFLRSCHLFSTFSDTLVLRRKFATA